MVEKESEFSRTSEEEQLYKDVLKGNKKTIVDHVKVCLAASSRPQKLLDEVLLPAINDVGAFFDQGRYFLPQLIASAESMKLAIEYLEPMLKEDSDKQDMPTVVIATVAGDVHDIGKNLVAMMLKNYGFTVIDLGKDVDTELIVKTAIEENAKIIGLSALMTTTMQEMRVVVKTAKEKGYTGKIMVGGAVVTQEFADEIGADGYSKDAAEAVKVAEKLCGLA